jgi:probable addiction module antidote protein
MNSYNKTLFIKSLCDNDEAIQYLNYSLRWSKDEFLFALCNVAIAKGGVQRLASSTGFGKESLYKTLMPHTNPRFETILKIVRALGFDFDLVPTKENYRNKLQIIRKNSLTHLYPDLALEWNQTRNSLTPNDVLPSSRKKIWWQCPKDSSHSWQESCNARTKSLSKGCPSCNSTKYKHHHE